MNQNNIQVTPFSVLAQPNLANVNNNAFANTAVFATLNSNNAFAVVSDGLSNTEYSNAYAQVIQNLPNFVTPLK